MIDPLLVSPVTIMKCAICQVLVGLSPPCAHARQLIFLFYTGRLCINTVGGYCFPLRPLHGCFQKLCTKATDQLTHMSDVSEIIHHVFTHSRKRVMYSRLQRDHLGSEVPYRSCGDMTKGRFPMGSQSLPLPSCWIPKLWHRSAHRTERI